MDVLKVTEILVGAPPVPQSSTQTSTVNESSSLDSRGLSCYSTLPTENKNLRHIIFQFGELRLIGIASMQTTLLLLRATAWRMYLLIPFHRQEQLPYFTHVPDSLAQKVLHQIVDNITTDVSTLGPTQKPQELKNAIDATLQAENTLDLLNALEKLSVVASDCWQEIIKLAYQRWEEQASAAANKPDKSNQDKDLEELWKAFGDLIAALDKGDFTTGPTTTYFQARCMPKPDSLVLEWEINEDRGSDFLATLINVAQSYRTTKQPYAPLDRLAFHAGYYLLSQGQNPFNPYKCRTLRTPGFREPECQTYLSLTDPGQGHVFGTTLRPSWMKGAIVHVEHLERPGGTTRAQIESYRIPSVLEFARVRLHTGGDAPNTCYIGRPLQDNGDLKYDFIKVVDTVASACTSMFQLGSAECKIAMGSLKASDMVAYMRALGGHTLKNYRQCFSAAFNLNTPLVDDIKGRYYTDPMKIARRAIKLTALGGFDKVTWDGASDSYPSVPLLQSAKGKPGLLTLQNARELVHRAHAAGLLTYFSAGFKSEHIKIAVYSGVDGIGIGGAQVLRSMDHETGMHGEYLESRIDELIDKRDDAAQDTFGRAATLLARLDQMYYEGSLNDEELQERNQLYDALDKEEPSEKILKDKLNTSIALEIFAVPSDGDNYWTARAQRLLKKRDGKPSLLEVHGGKDWSIFSESLESILDQTTLSKENLDSQPGNPASVEGNIHSFSMSPLWKKRRAAYREWLAEDNKKNGKSLHKASKVPKYFRGEIDLNVKATPFESSQALVVSDLFRARN